MDHLRVLKSLLLVFALFLGVSAHATIVPVNAVQYRWSMPQVGAASSIWYNSNSDAADAARDWAAVNYYYACNASGGGLQGFVVTGLSTTGFTLQYTCSPPSGTSSTHTIGGILSTQTAAICPANSTLFGSICNCNSGYMDSPQTPNTCSAQVVTNEALGPQSCPTCVGNPILPLLGVKREPVHTGIIISGLELLLLYDSSTALRPPIVDNATGSELPAFGPLWKSNFHHKLQVAVGGKGALLSLGNGQVLTFTGDGAGNFSPYGYNKERLTTTTGGYRLARLDGVIESFDSSGNLITLAKPDGAVLSFTYAGDLLQSVQSNEGRIVRFAYAGNLITSIRAPDNSTVAAAYSAGGNLTALTWPDGHAKTFLYENAALPWALTGVVDENNSRYATFAYDSAGHAVSTEHAGGVDKYSVSYASAPTWLIQDTFDGASNTVYRKHTWQPPAGTVLTRPNGEHVTYDAQAVIGIPSVTAQSQPAGSGAPSTAANTSYDSSGNVASRDDTVGARTCYAYDSSNRETVRVEGLVATVDCATVTPNNAGLPPGARLITTSWHPDWKLPTVITEPLKKITVVYHGQPDPFNGNVTASCTSAPNRADGKPVPLVCKQVEQALLAGGSVDASVPAATTTYTYDIAGRALTATDARSHPTAYSYYPGTSFTGGGDSDFDKTVLLLHADGTNGSTSITDSSPVGNPITVYGGAQLTTSQFKYGTAAASFNGTNAWLRAPQSANFQIFGGDFTVEWWANFAGVTSTGIMVQLDAGATNRAVVGLSTGNLVLYTEIGGNYGFRISAPVSSDNTWHHIALTRSGGTIALWLDGTAVGSTTTSLLPTGNLYCSIGSDANVGGHTYFKGYIDDLRITKDVARYAVNFTPPAAAFPDASVDMNSVGHTAGDLQSVTNAAGQVTQYTQYDPAGRVRQMVDAKGITTDITYTPRGWVSTVSVTPPGGSVRTTSYSYDGAGQTTAVSLPDGTSLAYTYDAAHRLTGVTDTQGNSVTYTLDAAGNRVGEDLRGAGGALRRSIARSFDALNRLQQVTGAAQ